MLALLLSLSALVAEAGAEAPPVSPPATILESFGPLAASARADTDKSVLFAGGVLRKEDDDAYRRAVNTGADPSAVPGPEKIHSGQLDATLTDVKTVFEQPGYHVNNPSLFRPSNSRTLYMYYDRGPNKIAEACRKKESPLRFCEEYLQAREIALATSADDGKTWRFEQVVVKGADSGDGTGPGQPAAQFIGSETWLYYTTANPSKMKENIFRLRLSLDGKKRLAEPEAVKLEGFAPGQAIENVQLVRLKCDEGGKFVSTLVANNRAQDAIPLYVSEDGLKFRAAPGTSIVPHAGHALVAPAQLPGPASVEECNGARPSGTITFRDLVWAEQLAPPGWALRRAGLSLTLP